MEFKTMKLTLATVLVFSLSLFGQAPVKKTVIKESKEHAFARITHDTQLRDLKELKQKQEILKLEEKLRNDRFVVCYDSAKKLSHETYPPTEECELKSRSSEFAQLSNLELSQVAVKVAQANIDTLLA